MTALVLGSAEFMDHLQTAVGSHPIHLVSATGGPLLERSIALYEPDAIIVESGRPNSHHGILRSLLSAPTNLTVLAVVGDASLDLASSGAVVSLQYSDPVNLLVYVLSDSLPAAS